MSDKTPLRIAIVGLSIEVMLASPIPTDAAALTRFGPNDILNGDLWLIRGMLDRLSRDGDVDILPLCWAKALPGGPLARDIYEAIKADTVAELEGAGRLDGVLVANHGALEVSGLGVDADTDFIEALRAAIGPDLPMAVALDLHGDMTPGFLAAATTFSVLRTAPHRDDRETGHRAADQLLHIIRNRIRPSKAAVRIPILATGETAMTTFAPADDLYGSLPDYDSRPGIIEANILVGFAWNDRRWSGMTAIAVSDGDAETARAAAFDLAADIWRRRSEFGLHMETAEVGEGLLRAVEAPQRPAFVSDSGDNTTAGASGDLTLVLQAALADPRIDDVVVAGIRAPQTVAQLIAAGVGAEIEIVLGAEHISRPQTKCRVMARVEACGPRLVLPDHQPASSEDEVLGVRAHRRCAGDVPRQSRRHYVAGAFRGDGHRSQGAQGLRRQAGLSLSRARRHCGALHPAVERWRVAARSHPSAVVGSRPPHPSP